MHCVNKGTYRGTSFVIHDLSCPSDDTSRKRMISQRPFFRIVLPAGTEPTMHLLDVWSAKETHEPDTGSVRSRSNTLSIRMLICSDSTARAQALPCDGSVCSLPIMKSRPFLRSSCTLIGEFTSLRKAPLSSPAARQAKVDGATEVPVRHRDARGGIVC